MIISSSLKCLQQKVLYEILYSKLIKKKWWDIVDSPDQEMVNLSKSVKSEGLKALLESKWP
jgi:hypothetical protein